jgi:uncharacterized protein (TIGR02145 family)
MKNRLIITRPILVVLSILFIYSCKKDPELPVIITQAVREVSYTTAISGGTVTSEGGAPVTARGVCWHTSENPTISDSIAKGGIGSGPFSSSIRNLSSNTLYYLRAYAQNTGGTAYGNEISFTTSQFFVPTLTTKVLTIISNTTVFSGGDILDDNGAPITAMGVCWGPTPNPTIDLSNKTIDYENWYRSYGSIITDFLPDIRYYVRAYATNLAGTGYGNEKTFIIRSPGPTIADFDGNIYNTVAIGTQLWMAENLKTTRYDDGTSIPLVTDDASWKISGPAYCWYNNDSTTYKSVYGALYNWSAAVGLRNVCPMGWHVPTDEDWKTLTTFLGGDSVAGGKLKEAGTSHWISPNAEATNETNFTALPGGLRYYNGAFNYLGLVGNWWSKSVGYFYNPITMSMYAYYSYVTNYSNYAFCGLSVRCIRDF